jgi:polyhydroxybutyrate depolymerase
VSGGPGGTHALVVAAGGAERRALLHLPPADIGPARRALVVMIHGAGATAQLALQNTGWATLADSEGFAVAFPEGTPRHADRPSAFLQNPQTWNDGSGRGHVARQGVDDVAFIAALLDAVAARTPIDADRVYLAGFSNGAGLAYLAGEALAERVAAIAAVAGHCWLEAPRPARPVPLIGIYGGADPINPLEGGEVTTPWGRVEYHPPARASVARWAAGLGCGATPELVHDGAGVRVERWSGCAADAEALLCAVADMGHVWPGGARLLPLKVGGPATQALRGTETIWEFFRRHPRRA